MLRNGLPGILLLFVVLTATGQQPNPLDGGKSDSGVSSSGEFEQRDVDSLLRERDGLTKEIQDLTTDIYWLNDAISRRDELNQAKALKKPTDEIEKAIAESLKSARLAGTACGDFDKQLELKNQSVPDKQKRIVLIDAELVRRADVVGPQQKFKLEMSLIFAGLVGLVIAGFFYVAIRDEQVRREIFSGQAGIQFVTLFSLVPRPRG